MGKKENMKHKLKIVIIIIMVLGMALAGIGPALAQEDGEDFDEIIEEGMEVTTRERIRERIKEIKEISGAIEEERDLREEPIRPGVPQGFFFDYELRHGARGEPVRHLQAVLNVDPDTRIANRGPGAPGSETEYFGPATRDALLRFQRKHGISQTGILGPRTREKANEIIREGVSRREAPGEGVSENIRERVQEIGNEVREMKEEVEDLDAEEGANEERVAECREDIEEAHERARGRVCTDEFRKMQCPEGPVTYGAPNGCIISFLEERGWK